MAEKTRSVRKELFRRYGQFPLRYRIQIRQRWIGAPYLTVEKYLPKQGTILDLGCGMGLFSHILNITGPNRQIAGIDNDASRIKLARITDGQGRGLGFKLGDIRKISFQKCQGIVLFDVLHHLDYGYHQDLLNRCFRVLSRGGVLVLMESGRKPAWKYRIWQLFEFIATGLKITKGDSVSLRSPEELEHLLKGLGFSVKMIPLDKNRLFPHVLVICKKN